MANLQSFTFVVRDSEGVDHEVTFIRHSAGHMSAHCTCSVDETERYCGHRLQLLDGDTTNLVSGNELEVEVLDWWLSCMDLKQTVARVRTEQRAGRAGQASAARILAHWPELSAEDFAFERDEAETRKLGAA
ncbi:MAG: hypothetical protein U5R14_03640 [Gemmatimonadota bacterium]|nr:hypothetical protein [Gemmatimonadota bacterium]